MNKEEIKKEIKKTKQLIKLSLDKHKLTDNQSLEEHRIADLGDLGFVNVSGLKIAGDTEIHFGEVYACTPDNLEKLS